MSIEKYPYLIDRLKASFIDGLLIISMMFGIAQILALFDAPLPGIRFLSFIGLFVLYEPILVSMLGGTVGHFMIRLRVKKESNYESKISFFSALVRVIVKILLGWVSLLTVSANEHKRALHDFASGSVVLKK